MLISIVQQLDMKLSYILFKVQYLTDSQHKHEGGKSFVIVYLFFLCLYIVHC